MRTSFGEKPLAVPTPVWCVGSYDPSGKPNVMTIAWGGICCSKPACLTISLRKATYTFGNIMERRAYTVNIPSARYAKEVDYFGMVSGREADKFAVTGLTPEKAPHVDAPLVAEFPMVIECTLLQTVEIGLHTQFIGEIKDVLVDDAALDASGKPDMALLAPFVFAPETREYFAVGERLGKGFSLGESLRKQD